MARIKQEKTPEEFEKITKKEFHNLWYNRALTLRQIGIIYGVDRKTVNKKRKELKLTTINCALLWFYGGDTYKTDKQIAKEKAKLEKQARKIEKDLDKFRNTSKKQ